MADIRYPQAASHPVLFTVPQAASDVISRITWLCWSGCAFNISYWQRFLRRDIMEETRRAGVNVSNCIRLHGHALQLISLSLISRKKLSWQSIHTYSATANASTAQYFTGLDCHAGVVLADCNLTPEALEWVLPLLMKFRCLSIPFPNLKQTSKKLVQPDPHSETNTK